MFLKKTKTTTCTGYLGTPGRKAREIIILTFLISLASPRCSYAYIDPGSGSYFLQLILAALFGALYAVKIFWSKIRVFFRSLLPGRKRP